MADLNLDYDLPETWQGKMEALVAGVVDYDDWEEVAMQCAEICDAGVIAHHAQALKDGRTVDTHLWSAVMPQLLDDLLSMSTQAMRSRKQWKALCDELVNCGKAADAVEGGKAEPAIA